jgi:hypothetical protein
MIKGVFGLAQISIPSLGHSTSHSALSAPFKFLRSLEHFKGGAQKCDVQQRSQWINAPLPLIGRFYVCSSLRILMAL